MNELYAVEPSIFKSSNELKYLLRYFGPFVGQYLAIYPKDWISQVKKNFEYMMNRGEISEIELTKIYVLLVQAEKRHSMIHCPELIERYGRTWLENVAELLRREPPVFSDIVAIEAPPPGKKSLDEFEPPINASERFYSTVDGYKKICRVLISISREFAIIDPYINLLDTNSRSVLYGLLSIAAKTKHCERILIWTSSKMLEQNYDRVCGKYDVAKTKNYFQIELIKIAKQVNLSKCQLELNFVNSSGIKDKFHTRCILSIKGGIKIDQGFKVFNNGQQINDADPIGEKSHSELFSIYFESKNDMSIDKNPIKFDV